MPPSPPPSPPSPPPAPPPFPPAPPPPPPAPPTPRRRRRRAAAAAVAAAAAAAPPQPPPPSKTYPRSSRSGRSPRDRLRARRRRRRPPEASAAAVAKPPPPRRRRRLPSRRRRAGRRRPLPPPPDASPEWFPAAYLYVAGVAHDVATPRLSERARARTGRWWSAIRRPIGARALPAASVPPASPRRRRLWFSRPPGAAAAVVAVGASRFDAHHASRARAPRQIGLKPQRRHDVYVAAADRRTRPTRRRSRRASLPPRRAGPERGGRDHRGVLQRPYPSGPSAIRSRLAALDSELGADKRGRGRPRLRRGGAARRRSSRRAPRSTRATRGGGSTPPGARARPSRARGQRGSRGARPCGWGRTGSACERTSDVSHERAIGIRLSTFSRLASLAPFTWFFRRASPP